VYESVIVRVTVERVVSVSVLVCVVVLVTPYAAAVLDIVYVELGPPASMEVSVPLFVFMPVLVLVLVLKVVTNTPYRAVTDVPVELGVPASTPVLVPVVLLLSFAELPPLPPSPAEVVMPLQPMRKTEIVAGYHRRFIVQILRPAEKRALDAASMDHDGAGRPPKRAGRHR
jgi:hypothetical protein